MHQLESYKKNQIRGFFPLESHLKLWKSEKERERRRMVDETDSISSENDLRYLFSISFARVFACAWIQNVFTQTAKPSRGSRKRFMGLCDLMWFDLCKIPKCFGWRKVNRNHLTVNSVSFEHTDGRTVCRGSEMKCSLKFVRFNIDSAFH